MDPIHIIAPFLQYYMYFSPIFLFRIHIIAVFSAELYVCEAGHGAKNTYNKAISRVFYVIRIFPAGFTASPAPFVPQNHLLRGLLFLPRVSCCPTGHFSAARRNALLTAIKITRVIKTPKHTSDRKWLVIWMRLYP